MKREMVEQVLADRQLKAKAGVYEIPKGEAASLLIGQGQLSTVGGVVSIAVEKNYLKAITKKGTVTYLEYGTVQALSFEPKEVADRHAGFV